MARLLQKAHLQRAVRAVLAIQRALAELNRRTPARQSAISASIFGSRAHRVRSAQDGSHSKSARSPHSSTARPINGVWKKPI